ncbi:MAG: hypothetical protein Q9169_002716 [Polycauliona sp. 2 TL-2023]
MAEEFVESCLPIFRDNELDDDQRPEEVKNVLRSMTALRGQQLDNLTLRVAHLCRERIQAEQASSAATQSARPPRASRIEVHRPSGPSSSRTGLPSTTTGQTVPSSSTTITPAVAARWNLNAPEFIPATLPSRSQPRPDIIPAGPALLSPSQPRSDNTPNTSLSWTWRPSPEEQHESYKVRLHRNDVGITLIDSFLIPRENWRIEQAQTEIAILQSEHYALTREFFQNSPPWSMYEGEGEKRVRGWTVREWQIDVLKTFIRECPQAVLRNLRDTREAYFQDIPPGDWEMGPGEYSTLEAAQITPRRGPH